MEMFIRNSVTGSNWNFLAEDPAWAEDFVIDGMSTQAYQERNSPFYRETRRVRPNHDTEEICKVSCSEGARITVLMGPRTLETIAEKGADAFYTGEIGNYLDQIQMTITDEPQLNI